MAKKTPAATDNAQDSAQKQPEAAIAPQSESAPQAASTLPFAQKREELIKKFRANAVPREADYKQLLDQHYDVAGALGMANTDDNNGGKTGNGLVFENEKLHVKAKATGGLLSDTNGVSLDAGKSLVIGTDNTVNVKTSNKNGLKISEGGEVEVNLYSYNADSDSFVAAVISHNPTDISGLGVNVGGMGSKKGLKQYKSTYAAGAVLGVSHDDTLKIDSSTGKLGVMPHASGGLVSSTNGLMLNTSKMSGLKIESNALRMATGSSLEIDADNKVNVKISGTNGLKITTNGEVGVSLYSNNADYDGGVAAVISSAPKDIDGIWINVGAANGEKKGLKQYKGTGPYGAVLGVSHDNTLKINSTGQLGLKVDDSTIKINSSGQLYSNFTEEMLIIQMARLHNCHLYGYSSRGYFIAYVNSSGTYLAGFGRGADLNGVNYNSDSVYINGSRHEKTHRGGVGSVGYSLSIDYILKIGDAVAFTNTGDMITKTL
ncbi:hypothetical protein [Candidatus Pantoea multigeneris]|uniref:Uncharacterized protein n=1 Tax=Candidatus Pantoea multigeneris TaxID=2608357 RepID=A0ABX0RBB9_9GAMM|nr:hypothetical protein [Pantoea multigeneris]NIF20545.1 hypothetical protein [Pantoea multigeneris]